MVRPSESICIDRIPQRCDRRITYMRLLLYDEPWLPNWSPQRAQCGLSCLRPCQKEHPSRFLRSFIIVLYTFNDDVLLVNAFIVTSWKCLCRLNNIRDLQEHLSAIASHVCCCPWLLINHAIVGRSRDWWIYIIYLHKEPREMAIKLWYSHKIQPGNNG